VDNRQMELVGRYMGEIGLTPASRSRIAVAASGALQEPVTRIEQVIVHMDAEGRRVEEIIVENDLSQVQEEKPRRRGLVRNTGLDNDL